MFCANCGAKLQGDGKNCPSCGVSTESTDFTPSGTGAIAQPQIPDGEGPVADSIPGPKPRSIFRKVLTWIFLFIIAVLVLVTITTMDLMVPVNGSLEALRRGDVEKAYQYSSEAYRRNTPIAAFKQFVADTPALTAHTMLNIEDRGLKLGDVRRVKGHLATNGKRLATIDFSLVQENGSWKINDLKVYAPDK